MKKSPTRFIRRVDNKFTSASLDLNFQNMTTSGFDSRITFTRASSGTYFDGSGILQTASTNVPRLDHSPTTLQSLGLLIEEQRTNLVTYSAEFDNAAWTKTNATITANTIVAPDGTLTADALVEDTTNGVHRAFQFPSVAGATHTHSCYVKAGTRSFFYFDATDSGGVRRVVWFDVSTGTVGTVQSGWTNASIVPQGNGWFRCSASLNMQAGTNLMICGFASANSISVYTGNGQVAGYLWGAQLEVGAFPTSYIPTTVAAATRNADVASMTGTNFSSWYNATEGTLYAEAAFVGLATARQVVNVSDNSANNLISIQTNPSTATSSRMNVISGGTTQSSLGFASAFTAGVFSKNAGTYKTDDFAFSSNGATATTDTSGTVPSVTQLQIGALLTTTSNIHIRRIAYYPVRLSNDQLQALTR